MINTNAAMTEEFIIGSNDNIDLNGLPIDLSKLDMQDTLIGSAAKQLSQCLGDPETDLYEAYHKGDPTISDIQLQTFDSRIIRNAFDPNTRMPVGIKPYYEEVGEQLDEDPEFNKIIGKDKSKSSKSSETSKSNTAKEKSSETTLLSIVKSIDNTALLYDEFYRHEITYDLLDSFDEKGNVKKDIDDDETVLYESDFDFDDEAFGEDLVIESYRIIDSGELDEEIKTDLDKGIRLVK